MPREELSISSIRKLARLLRAVFSFILELENESVLATRLKKPQLPPVLSESLALYLLERKEILEHLRDYSFTFGYRQGDPDIIATSGENEIRIEVKATGDKAFQYFSEKDLLADFLVWIHFGRYFLDTGTEGFEVYILEQPRKYENEYPKSRKITLGKLKEIIGAKLVFKKFNLNSLG
jgi:hypothetical protein